MRQMTRFVKGRFAVVSLSCRPYNGSLTVTGVRLGTMPSKNLLPPSRGVTAPKRQFIPSTWKNKKARVPASSPGVSVRSEKEIPASVLDFFKLDPKTKRPFTLEEKLFYAQVFMHEIDEGCRLLARAGRAEEAKTIGNFSNKLHLFSRLELLRKVLEENDLAQLPPERVQHAHKARNNQWGALKTRLGTHPAVAVTACGVGYKDCNEDAYLVLSEHKILALADGMGGHVAGHLASCIAIDFFEREVSRGADLEDAITRANDAILLRSRSDPRLGGIYPMGCTFAAIQIKHSQLKIAHVGDTKVMVLRDGKIFLETQDHTQGQQLLREGLIDRHTAFELNHILNRCLGLDAMRAQRDVAVTTVVLKPGDRLVLATDGITDNFFDENFKLDELAKVASQGPLPQAADAIISDTENRMCKETLPDNRPSKRDNMSLAMAEYRG